MSTATQRADQPMTVAEFLAYDDGTQTRYELVNGALVAMNPPATRHAEVVQNIGEALNRQLGLPCRAFWGGLGIARSEEDQTWREPDLIVTCTRPQPGFFSAPRLIVEVLSPSTERDDRTTKLDFYETFPSVEAILLVWQDERRVRLRERGPDRWIDQDVIGTGTVLVRSLNVELTLDDIYADPWITDGEALA